MAGAAIPPALGFGALAGGRVAVGTGGLPGTPGLLAIGGGPGLGFAATGGGFEAIAPPGLDAAGVASAEEPFVAVEVVRFHGAADPLAAAIPGKTATGFAEGSAETAFAAAVGTTEGGRLFAGGGGGGGGGASAALGFGGTSSR